MSYYFETERHGALWFAYIWRSGDDKNTAPPVKEFHAQAETDESVTRLAAAWIATHNR